MSDHQIRTHAWWKPTKDALASYLNNDQTQRMLASSASLGPSDWQERAHKTLGQRLGKVITGTLRAGYSLATLGLSEKMLALSKPGLLTGNEPMPPLDLVVGPTEAAILIVDGVIETVLNAERFRTHDAWDRLEHIVGWGKHLEVVMLDTAPIGLTVPLRIVMGSEEINAEIEAEISLGLEAADRVLNLLARSGPVLEGSDLDRRDASVQGSASFVTSASIADRLQRRVEHQVARMSFRSNTVTQLYEQPDAMHKVELELHAFLAKELGSWGFVVSRCQLILARSESQQLAIDARSTELAQQRRAMLAEAQLVDERRSAELESERAIIATERRTAQLHSEGHLEQIRESGRIALARMVLLNDQALDLIERDGFKVRREAEREEAVLDFRHEQLILREQRKQALEEQLQAAQTNLEVDRLKIQLEREKLDMAGLAQEQNLVNLQKLKKIERDDELLRKQAVQEAERERLSSAKDLTPEQMMAALADKDPEIAKAMASRFSSEADFARKSADDQKALMQEMQAQMMRLMEKGLDSNAAVAAGHLKAAGRAPAGSCGSCGETTQAAWKACPYCGVTLG